MLNDNKMYRIMIAAIDNKMYRIMIAAIVTLPFIS